MQKQDYIDQIESKTKLMSDIQDNTFEDAYEAIFSIATDMMQYDVEDSQLSPKELHEKAQEITSEVLRHEGKLEDDEKSSLTESVDRKFDINNIDRTMEDILDSFGKGLYK